MKEFDFDELDKAVNSLMGDIKKPEESAPVGAPTAPPTEAIQPVAAPSPTPVPPAPIVEPKPTTTPPPAPLPTPDTAASLVPRQGGRFMDVVHPSSDMKTATPTPAPSREGVAKQPLTVASRPAAPSTTFDVVAPAARPERETPPAAPTAPSESSPTETESSSMPSPTPSDAWSSPFLPDAQVEKRPLGGSLSAASETGLSEAIAAELSKGSPGESEPSTSPEPIPTPSSSAPAEVVPDETKDDGATKPAPESSEPSKKKGDVDLQLSPEAAPALPAELNSDLVAIESGQASTPIGGSPSIDSSPAAMLAASSIPTQYSEQPSTGDASHTPIYDNEAAHQPLAHPAKKKKSWLLIVAIVAILAVGGALGAVAYFLHLI